MPPAWSGFGERRDDVRFAARGIAMTPHDSCARLGELISVVSLDRQEVIGALLTDDDLATLQPQGADLGLGLSQHRSVQQAANYYNDAEAKLSRVARLMEWNDAQRLLAQGTDGHGARQHFHHLPG